MLQEGKTRIGLSVIVVTVLVACLFFVTSLQLTKMSSASMEPLIHGQRLNRSGDLILIGKLFSKNNVRRGDIVSVTYRINGEQVDTIRVVSGIEGDTIPSSGFAAGETKDNTVPHGTVWLKASAPNGVDSKELGLCNLSNINGRVLHIWHSKSCP